MPAAQKILNATELTKFRDEFDARFSITNGAQEIKMTRNEFNYSEILDLKDQHIDSKGLIFSYGLDEKNFVPVLELVKKGTTNPWDLIKDTAHRPPVNGGTMIFITAAQKSLLTSKYLDTVKVLRYAGNTTWDALDHDENVELSDCVSDLFAWEQVDELLDANAPTDDQRKLVVVCIAAEPPTATMGSGNNLSSPFRHLIALFVAAKGPDGSFTDLLDNTIYTGDEFKMKARDYGSVCPLTCPK